MPAKDDVVVSLHPDPLLLLHHFLGLYCAGVVGCATAYLLARKGVKVTLIEKNDIGSCASGFAAGLLNPRYGHDIPGPLDTMAQASFRMHAGLLQEVKEETGVDPQPREVPSIWVAKRDHEVKELRELLQLTQQIEGFQAWWLSGSEVRSLEPRVASGVLGGVYVKGTMQVACYQYTLALARAAEKYGATIRLGNVEGLKLTGRGVSAVVVGGELVACEKVVLAMGPWTGRAEEWLGVRVPVSPLKGQILRLELAEGPLEHEFYWSGGGYVSPKPDGLVWAGTTEERVGFDDHPTPEAREAIMRDAVEIIPALAEAQLALQTACLRPASEDDLPILGEAPGWEGIYLATGAGRKGILLAPAMAQAVVDMITTGRTDLPVEALSPGRFLRT